MAPSTRRLLRARLFFQVGNHRGIVALDCTVPALRLLIQRAAVDYKRQRHEEYEAEQDSRRVRTARQLEVAQNQAKHRQDGEEDQPAQALIVEITNRTDLLAEPLLG